MRVVEILCSELEDRVLSEMRRDGHGAPCPTHAVLMDGSDSIVGAYSLHWAPVVFFWMHTGLGTPTAAYRAFRDAMDRLETMGHAYPVLLCPRNSPFYAYAARLGFDSVGSGEVMV